MLEFNEMISFYKFLGSCIYTDPFYPLPTRRIREYRQLRETVKCRILSMGAERLVFSALNFSALNRTCVDEAGILFGKQTEDK